MTSARLQQARRCTACCLEKMDLHTARSITGSMRLYLRDMTSMPGWLSCTSSMKSACSASEKVLPRMIRSGFRSKDIDLASGRAAGGYDSVADAATDGGTREQGQLVTRCEKNGLTHGGRASVSHTRNVDADRKWFLAAIRNMSGNQHGRHVILCRVLIMQATPRNHMHHNEQTGTAKT